MEMTPRIEMPTQMRLMSLRLRNIFFCIIIPIRTRNFYYTFSVSYLQYDMTFFRRLIRKKILINIAFSAALIAVGYNTYGVVRRSFVLKEESAATRAKIEELTRRKQELAAELEELNKTPAIEREAKARLNMKNVGEEVVVVVPEKNTSANEKKSTTTPSFWDRIKNFFW